MREKELTMFSKLEKFLDSFIKMGVPGYDISVYHKGREVYRHQNGVTSLKNKTPMTAHEFYNVYSCSKTITVTAAMILIERGLLSLDDKLSKYLPEFEKMTVKCEGGVREAKEAITIKQLFTMTAGFNYNLNAPSLIKCREETNGRCQTREAMKYLALEPLDFEPGKYYQYSLCHDVLAAVVEVVAGVTFGEFVKKNIFDVAGMTETTYLPSPELIEKISGQFRYNAQTREMVEIGKDASYRIGSEYESGGAGIVSTVDDYIKFTEALRTGKLLSQESITEMTKDQLTPEQSSTRNDPNYGYGLGFRAPIGEGVTDFGWGGAAGAYIAIDREREISIFYAQHVLMSPNGAMRYKIAGLVKECLGYTSASTPEACYPCATLA